MIKTADLYNLSHSKAAALLEKTNYPWEILSQIGDYISELGKALPQEEYDHPANDVWIAKDAVVYASAYIEGPCIIGHKTTVRPGAFVRGNALVGDDCVIGNSTELKNVILFDGVQVPHYNYVGDSVLGYKAHMGAGAVTSNVKSDKTPVIIKNGDERVETGRKKVGAMIGDYAEIGCNSVLNPGTVVGRNSNIYPLSSVRGVVPADSIYKGKNDIVHKN